MTGQTVYNDIKAVLGIEDVNDFTAVECLIAINEALNNLPSITDIYASTILTVTEAKVFIDLPDGLISIKYIVDSNNDPYYNWKQLGQQVSFDAAGSYTIYYATVLASIVNITLELPIEEIYISSVKEYVKKWYWEREDEMDKADYYFGKFRELALTATIRFTKGISPKEMKVERRG